MIRVDLDQLERELAATSRHLGLLGTVARTNGLPGTAQHLRKAEDDVDVARAGLHLRAGRGGKGGAQPRNQSLAASLHKLLK